MSKGHKHKAKDDLVGKRKAAPADRSRADDAPKPPASVPAKRKTKAAAKPDKPKRPRGRPPVDELQNRCTATSKTTGERCRQPAIRGGNVCRYHGGASPQVQRSARGRLAELVMPAIETLNNERRTAKRSSDRQRAANSILDRAGITRGHSAEVDAARALLLERLLSLRSELPAGQADPLELVATVVDDDEGEFDDADDRAEAGS